MENKTALVTGAAVRLGRAMVCTLHEMGYTTYIHYNKSEVEAEELIERLNAIRPGSAIGIQVDLLTHQAVEYVAEQMNSLHLDVLINSASVFFPTSLSSISSSDWNALYDLNAKIPLLLTQVFLDKLRAVKGQVINIIDVNASLAIKDYLVYCSSKAALLNLTKLLAYELSPEVRVNGISPGRILQPRDPNQTDSQLNASFLQKIPLAKTGTPHDIAHILQYLVESNFITGQVISVDGGRSLAGF